jgi:hypothetical protein
MSDAPPEILFERQWSDAQISIRFHVDEDMRSFAVFEGKGSMDSARQFVKMCDDAIVHFGAGYETRSLVDLRSLKGAPLRSQFLLGKWLLKNKRYVAKIAVFGGNKFEMTLARAIMKIARMKHVGFFNVESDARSFLGFN